MTWVVFVAAASAAIVTSIGVVMAANPVHSALMLVGTLFSVAVMFVLQEAHFLAAVQVIVYAGAVVVLFLFVIMLLGVDRREAITEPLQAQRPLAIGAALLALAGLIVLIGGEVVTGAESARGPAITGESGNVERLGRSLFTDFIWPFEITGILLVIAVLGALVLVRQRGGHAEETRTAEPDPGREREHGETAA